MICIPYWVVAVVVFLVVVGIPWWKAEQIFDWALMRISTPIETQPNPRFVAFLRRDGVAAPATEVPVPERELSDLTRAAWRRAEDNQRRKVKRWRWAALGTSLVMWWALLHWGFKVL